MLCSSVASECLFFFFFSWECSNYLSTLNITSPVSAASSPFGMASWLCLLWINNGSPIYHKFQPVFYLFIFSQKTRCRLRLLVSTVLIFPPFLFFQSQTEECLSKKKNFSTFWQLDGKEENLWPWKMKMLLPWELLILLSLKECLAGETPSWSPFMTHLICILVSQGGFASLTHKTWQNL